MGLITKYTFQGDVIDKAYLRIKKITLSVSDEDELVTKDDGHQYSEFSTVNENMAFVFVYSDYESRKHNARPINQFGIFFDWNDDGSSPWDAAYTALKKTKRITENGYVDI